MKTLFRLSGGKPHDFAIDEWLSGEPDHLYAIARDLFARIRNCGDDVLELMHDGCATACVEDAAFAYVAVFKAHVNLGFFNGADLNDPQNMLEGTGKRMRHVKLRPGNEQDAKVISALIENSYQDIKTRLQQS